MNSGNQKSAANSARAKGRKARQTKRVSIGICELMDHALTRIKGRKICVRHHGGDYIDHATVGKGCDRSINHFLAVWLEEAVYAVEEFADKNGFVPRQPCFMVLSEEDGRPAEPRRWGKCHEMFALERFLKTALCKEDAP